jgi:hypothetical protein
MGIGFTIMESLPTSMAGTTHIFLIGNFLAVLSLNTETEIENGITL